MAALTQLTKLTRLTRTVGGGASGNGILQPIVLTKADGTVFTTADGKALVRGTQRVTPQD